MDSCPDTDIDPKFLPLSQYTHTPILIFANLGLLTLKGALYVMGFRSLERGIYIQKIKRFFK